MTKFQKALQTECGRCGKNASQHRMTKTTFYCTVLNAAGRARYLQPLNRLSGLVNLETIVYRTKVMNLQRATLSNDVRVAIAQGMSSIEDVQ